MLKIMLDLNKCNQSVTTDTIFDISKAKPESPKHAKTPCLKGFCGGETGI